MSQSHLQRRPNRARTFCQCSVLLILLATIGVLLWQPWGRRDGGRDISRVVTPPPMAPPVFPAALPDDPNELATLLKLWQDALDNDGRVMEKGVAVRATGLSSRRNLQLALDEVFSIGGVGELSGAGRIRPRADRRQLEEFVLGRVAAGGPATYPVLYVKDAVRRPAHLRVATGEIIAVLQPGVRAAEIAREYDLQPLPAGSSKVGLTRFFARNAFRALELVPRLAADPRIAMVDHDLIKPVEPKAFVPNDPGFADQWPLLPVVGSDAPQQDLHNIGMFPTLSGAASLLPNAAPVWGDFEEADGGFRGRGIRVGIVDDGVEFNHPDLQLAMAPFGEHRAYDMVGQAPRFPGDIPPPRVQGASGMSAEPIKQTLQSRAHGVLAAGLIGARANNNIGMAGVAPLSTLVGLRAFSYSYVDNDLRPPDSTDYRELQGNLLAPTQDVIIAAAFEFAKNDFVAGNFPSKRIYEGTFDETDMPSFADAAAGPTIHIKNIGFGAPDSELVDGPGPEVAGHFANGLFFPGARDRSLRDGRLGLGTVYVHPAGNGRFLYLDNSNNDGYANARGAIAVGGLGRFGMELPRPDEDLVAIYSDWGANLTVVAPGGGPFHRKTAASRAYNQRPSAAAVITRPAPLIVPVATTDWSINEPARPATSTTPAIPALFGLNPGGNIANEYQDGAYTRRFQGTSAAAAHVSGVVALMLEANPRLSWIDVQHILMRTARKHINPDSLVLNPTAANHPLIVDGIDVSDPADPVVIDQDWRKNGGHFWFNHKYGAGLVDAGRAVAEAAIAGGLINIDREVVELARGFMLPAQTDHQRYEFTNSTTLNLPDARPNNNPPGEVVMTLSANVPETFIITHVELRIDRVLTPFIGELYIAINSPSGMESILLEPRLDPSDDLIDWSFSSLRHWGENGAGEWRITFRDYMYDGNNSTFDDVVINKNRPGETGTPQTRLILHGYSRPEIPRISRPTGLTAEDPTVVEVTRNRNFNYSMTAGGRPTAWFLLNPTATENTPGLPPGLRMGVVTPSEATTYLDSRLITGSTNAPVGSLFDVEVMCANASGVSEVRYLRFEIVPPQSNDPFTQWGDFHFPPAAAGNPLAEGSADADGDGLITVLEYALGTSPVVADGDGAVTLSKDASDQWTYTFKRFITRGITYEVQVTDNLQTDSWTTVVRSAPATNSGVPESVVAGYLVSEGSTVPPGLEPQSGHRVVTVTNTPGTPPPLYYRLRVIPSRDPLNPL